VRILVTGGAGFIGSRHVDDHCRGIQLVLEHGLPGQMGYAPGIPGRVS
jgi:dTDP-D-glucose 4,6-dehydratase